uniref:DUF7622 domain-containing protein n=1 Tax=Angiostrongylus cantonensis TaxID=6313 RepID=A0A0K0DFB9_ANGCA
MSTALLSLLFVLYFAHDDVVALIQCKKCDYDFETEQEMEKCFFKGCISGITPSNGCRINQNGQVLCICDSDHCNADQMALKGEEATVLPYQVCAREMVNGIEPPQRWTPPCAGNFCTYKRSMFTLDNGTVGHSHSKDCSAGSDFDLFYTGLPFLFYPECCAKLEYGGQPDETICYGSMEDDAAADFTARELIECHADYMSKHLPYIPFMKLCKGHFCVIAASPHGDLYRYCRNASLPIWSIERGCITVDQSGSERQIEPGYYQSYNGMEQWICDSSNCNYDMQRMEESWPPELEEFRLEIFTKANTNF